MESPSLDRVAMRAQLDRYHSAISRGRHPVSFARATQPVWKFVYVRGCGHPGVAIPSAHGSCAPRSNSSEQIRKKLQVGQLLTHAVEEVPLPSFVQPSMLAAAAQKGLSFAASSPELGSRSSSTVKNPVLLQPPSTTRSRGHRTAAPSPVLASASAAALPKSTESSRTATPVTQSSSASLLAKLRGGALARDQSAAALANAYLASGAGKAKPTASSVAAATLLFAAKAKSSHKYLAVGAGGTP